ncbi:MAG: transglutaminase domain-containing protein [Clostridia bacterium]|nr:transglutaminase domain-containing protein [Clostridia bacterium]
MKKSLNGKQTLLAAVSLALVYLICVLSFAEVLMPQTGKKTKKNGSLVVDISNMDEGYVMVRGKKSKKKQKLVVKTGKQELRYDINSSGNYEVIPLQYGNGKYTFSLFENMSGNKYSQAGQVSLTAKMTDPNRAFLYPNQYVDYTPDTEAVKKAAELCEGLTEQAEIAKVICNFVRKNFAYDYMKANSVKKNDTKAMMPSIDDTWKKHMGVCQDLSALTVAMLRSQGVPAKLMIGDRKDVYHAWVVAIVDGDEKRFDPTAELEGKKYKKSEYTLERYY